MKKHQARPIIMRYRRVPGIDAPVPVWSATCEDCGRPVREMLSLSDHGRRHVFWHASGKAAADDPRRAPRPAAWNEAISAGVRAASTRRRIRQDDPSA